MQMIAHNVIAFYLWILVLAQEIQHISTQKFKAVVLPLK